MLAFVTSALGGVTCWASCLGHPAPVTYATGDEVDTRPVGAQQHTDKSLCWNRTPVRNPVARLTELFRVQHGVVVNCDEIGCTTNIHLMLWNMYTT